MAVHWWSRAARRGVPLLLVASGCSSNAEKPAPGVCEAPCEVVGEGFSTVIILGADESGVYAMDYSPFSSLTTLTRLRPGGGAPLVLAHPGFPIQMKLRQHRVYWSDVTNGLKSFVLSVGVDGGDVTTHYQSSDYLSLLSVDDDTAYMGIPDQSLYRVPLAGGARTAYDGFTAPGEFSLDNGALFVNDDSTCQIKSVPVAGGEPTLLYQGKVTMPFADSMLESCETQAVTTVAGNLLWQDLSEDWSSTELKTMPETGGTPRTLAGRYADANGPVGDATNVYLSVMPEGHGQSIFKVPLSGGKPELLFQGLPGPHQLGRIAADAHRVYFVEPVGDDQSRVLSIPK